MNLTIDIGNTNLTLGLFKKNRLIKRLALATKSPDYYPFLKKLFSRYQIDKVIVASVVPKATRKLEVALKRLNASQVLILGKNLVVPIKNRYQFPKQVGQDRLVNAFAAIKLYGAPAIVVDFGTAITFDAISRKQEYLGGLILPGMETSLAALKEKTALLPKIKLSAAPQDLIGKNTRQSMLSGVIFGFASLTDGIVNKLKRKLGQNTKVIGTGGNIRFIRRHCQEFSATDIDLTLKGLNLILK
jgi:type III pantothenate kinase